MAQIENIGIMLTYNEADVIEEVMKEHVKYFDKILVLDGSDDATPEIVRSFDAVKYFITDKDLNYSGRIVDGARGYLLQKAQETFGFDNWITLLHGDEIFYDDPNKIVAMAQKSRAQKVNWQPHNFFLHLSDKNQDFTRKMPVQERVLWYSPSPCLEIRQFRNGPNVCYDLNRHGQVMPDGVGLMPLLYYPNYKHYLYRSPEQILKKHEASLKKGSFSPTYQNKKSYADCFVEKLGKINRKWDGNFHEFEMSEQMKPWNLVKRGLLREKLY